MAKAVDAILDALEEGGVRCLFAIPDPAFLELLAKAQARGFVLVAPHHEAAGGFMAEAAARLTGVPAAVLLSPGPGVANALPAMACARAERAPVLFLGGARGDLREPHLAGRFQHMDQMPLVAGAVKYAARIAAPGQAGAVVAHALMMARGGTPGPVYVDCPFPVMMGRGEQGVPAPVPPVAGSGGLVRAAAMIGEAGSPLLLVGHGLDTQARARVADLARVMACPVLLAPGAAALPGLAGQCLPYGFSPVATQAIARADLVLAIGTALGEAVHHGRRRHWRAGDEARRWIRIDGDVTANRPIDVALVGDAGVWAQALAGALTPRESTPDPLFAAEAERLAQWNAAARVHPATPVHPARLVAEAMSALPPDALLVRDGGSSVLFQLAQSRPHEGGVLWSRAFGHLGTGLPYAIGALAAEKAMGMPLRQALVLSGDSAMLFHMAEIEVAVRLALPLVCVVAVDHQWGLEAAAYRQRLGADAPRPGADWGAATRFDQIARGFGAKGFYTDNADDLPAILERALAHGGPAVVHVAVDVQANGADLPGWAELASWYSDGMGA